MEYILEEFPKWQLEIDQLHAENIDFQELCQDYEEVRTLVASWNDPTNVNKAKIDEYQTLLNDLKLEIMEELQGRFATAVSPDQNTPSQPNQLTKQEHNEEV